MDHTPTSDELRSLLRTILVGATGAPESHWDIRLGEMVRADLTRGPKSNWTLTGGKRTPATDAAVDSAVAIVRAEHPYCRW